MVLACVVMTDAADRACAAEWFANTTAESRGVRGALFIVTYANQPIPECTPCMVCRATYMAMARRQ
jgi:cytidine deaminase